MYELYELYLWMCYYGYYKVAIRSLVLFINNDIIYTNHTNIPII